MRNDNGLFVAVEGMDGSGKSTVTAMLVAELEKLGEDCVKTYEVGGTPVGKELRKLCFSKRDDEVIDNKARLLMVLASRIQHITNVITPALTAGKIVVTDRYAASTLVYQGFIDGLQAQIGLIQDACKKPTVTETEPVDDEVPQRQGFDYDRFGLGVNPDVIVHIDVNYETAYKRGAARKDVDNDQYKTDLHRAYVVNFSYKAAVEHEARRTGAKVFTIDGNQPIENVAEQITAIANELKKLRNHEQAQ